MKKKLFVVLVLVMAVILSACGNDSDTGASSTNFNDPDVEFAQGMIPHHRQAVEMAELAETRAASAEVKELAAAIQGAQDPEIQTMEGWLKDWDKPLPDEGMSGMDHGSTGDDSMPGMMSTDDMESMSKASGTEFDKMFLSMMITHHEGAIEMAESEITNGTNADAITLAKQIKDAQTGEIATMTNLLKQ